MLVRRFYDYINTTDKFITEKVEKVKKNWLKSDKEKLKILKEEEEKLENELDLLNQKENKLYSKKLKVEKQIDKINKKYSYTKKVRVKNVNYQEPKYEI